MDPSYFCDEPKASLQKLMGPFIKEQHEFAQCFFGTTIRFRVVGGEILSGEKCQTGKRLEGENPRHFQSGHGGDRSAIRPDLPPERKRNNRTCAPKRKKNDGGFSPTYVCPVSQILPDSTSISLLSGVLLR